MVLRIPFGFFWLAWRGLSSPRPVLAWFLYFPDGAA